jgi:hypothetical protein
MGLETEDLLYNVSENIVCQPYDEQWVDFLSSSQIYGAVIWNKIRSYSDRADTCSYLGRWGDTLDLQETSLVFRLHILPLTLTWRFWGFCKLFWHRNRTRLQDICKSLQCL